jgi:hypothetical protein
VSRVISVVPDGGGHDASVAGDAQHLIHAALRIAQEVQDQLGEDGVERVVGERELLGCPRTNIGGRKALGERRHEGPRRIDCCHVLLADDAREHPGELAGSGTDVQCAHARLHVGATGELPPELIAVAADETVVDLGLDRERHVIRCGSE